MVKALTPAVGTEHVFVRRLLELGVPIIVDTSGPRMAFLVEDDDADRLAAPEPEPEPGKPAPKRRRTTK